MGLLIGLGLAQATTADAEGAAKQDTQVVQQLQSDKAGLETHNENLEAEKDKLTADLAAANGTIQNMQKAQADEAAAASQAAAAESAAAQQAAAQQAAAQQAAAEQAAAQQAAASKAASQQTANAPGPQVVNPPQSTYYANCAAAKAAGAAPLYAGSPGYRAGLDRDGDGIACEK